MIRRQHEVNILWSTITDKENERIADKIENFFGRPPCATVGVLRAATHEPQWDRFFTSFTWEFPAAPLAAADFVDRLHNWIQLGRLDSNIERLGIADVTRDIRQWGDQDVITVHSYTLFKANLRTAIANFTHYGLFF